MHLSSGQSSSSPDITDLLLAWRSGDGSALSRLMPLVYAELKRLAQRQMRQERAGQTLQATALVNEVYLRLVRSSRVDWRDRAHFFAVAAQLMRRVLVDAARRRGYLKRGGESIRVALDERSVAVPEPAIDLVALDDALVKLAAVAPRKARVVELRYFGGLTIEETAEAMKVSIDVVKREWRTARLWLMESLDEASGGRRALESD